MEMELRLISPGTQTELRLISPFPSTTSTHKIHKQINEQKYNQIKIKEPHGKKLMAFIQKKSKPKTFWIFSTAAQPTHPRYPLHLHHASLSQKSHSTLLSLPHPNGPTSASGEVEIGVQRPPVVAHRSLIGTGSPSLSLILSVSALCRTASLSFSLLFSPFLILTFSLFSMEEEGDKRNKRKEKKEVGRKPAGGVGVKERRK